jgi:hypothetical protein
VKRVSTIGLAALAVASLGIGAFALTNRSNADETATTVWSIAEPPPLRTSVPGRGPAPAPVISVGVRPQPTVDVTTTASSTATTTTIELAGGDLAGEGNNNDPTIDPASGEPTVGVPTVTTRVTTAPTTAVTTATPIDAPETVGLTCTAQPAPVAVHCEWKGLPAGTEPRLLRGTNGSAAGERIATPRGADALDDDTVQPGTNYAYRMYAVRADGNVVAVSPLVTVSCCGT